jgi:transposase-like protein
LTAVDNSDISPIRLTFPLEAPYPTFSEGNGPFSSFQAKRILHEPPGVLARVLPPVLPRAALCPLLAPSWSYPVESSSQGARPASASVRPWREVKSRRGAPKRVNTEGFACPNPQCAYFGITDAHVHALVGDGKHGQAERIQTFRGPACRTTFTSRRNTPLYRLKTPSHQIAMVLSALAEGLDPSEASRVFGYRQATITSLSHSRWRTCADLARTLLLQSSAPASAAG